jgi:hypothetical protein
LADGFFGSRKEVIPPFSPVAVVFRGRSDWTTASLVTLAHFKHGPEISRDLNVSSFGILFAKERNLPKFARDFERLQYLGDCSGLSTVVDMRCQAHGLTDLEHGILGPNVLN